MQVLIENLQEKVVFTEKEEKLIEKVIESCIKHENISTKVEISVLIVDDNEIKSINKEFRSIDKETDVLSFPIVDMTEGKIITSNGDYDFDSDNLMLGDIIISLEMVERQAKEYGHSFERELAFMCTHGMYHLLGYDHCDKRQEELMFGKQEEVLKEIGTIRD